jgi:alpha-beta hydrolase superfamily lysophospholipase
MIDTFFFASGPHRLFAAYHPPAATAARRNSAVLLSAPAGHEYVQSYFACRTLAAALSARGFPVLRFDYRGCGNSSGDLVDSDLAHWQDDLVRAADVLRDRAGLETICVGGLRFGATLAALAAQTDPSIRSIVLWEAVFSGSFYVEELRAAHAVFLARLGLVAAAARDGDPVELLGFTMNGRMLRDVAAIEPQHLAHAIQGRHVLLIDGAEDASDEAKRQLLATPCSSFAHVHDPGAEAWRGDPHHVFLPGKAIREIGTWMDRLD